MRWPFRPPHLTLNPPKEKKTQYTGHRKQNKGRVRWGQAFGAHLTLNSSNPNRLTKPPKWEKKTGKSGILAHLQLHQRHNKRTTKIETQHTNHIHTHTQLTTPNQTYNKKLKLKQHLVCMFKQKPLFLVNFLVWQLTPFVSAKAVLCRKHYKIVFSRAQPLWITNNKQPFRYPFRKHPFRQKRWFWGFALCLLKPRFCSIFSFFTETWKRTIQIAKTDIVDENALFFTPFKHK